MFKVYRTYSVEGLFASLKDALACIGQMPPADSYSVKRVASSHFLVYRRHPMHARPDTFDGCERAIVEYSRVFQGEFEIVKVSE